MIGYLRGSASGMLAQQLRVDAVADNLANVNTIGHKATRIDFQDLTYRNISPTGQYKNITDPKTLSHIQLGVGVGVANTTSDLSQGNISQTGGPFDLAIVGEGYFMVELANGSAAYTRDGAFRIDSGGRLVSESGGIALPQVTLPPDASDPWVSTEGIIYARIGGADEPTQIGELQLARFTNPGALLAVGDNLLLATSASGPAQVGYPNEAGFGQIIGGALEMSNVDTASEMTNLLVAQRAYQMNAKALQTMDEMLGLANSLRG